jgi:hypothetical protein
MRAAAVGRRDWVQTRPASTPVFLRKSGRPETCGPNFVVSWKRLPRGVPADQGLHCHVAVALGAATDGKAVRSEGRLNHSRRMPLPVSPEAESRSSSPRHASVSGNPQPNGLVGGENLELVRHFVVRRNIFCSRPYPRHFSQWRQPCLR